MSIDRVKLQDIVANQLPQYVVEDFPLLPEFLQQYYTSQEFQSGPVDILKNIDQYVKVDELYDLQNNTILGADLDYTSDTVSIASSVGTQGFVDRDGIIKIDNEIIYYEYKTDTSFENCSRGFSGITTYISSLQPDQLDFSETEIDDHKEGSKVYNLNILFLQQFFKRLKGQVVPGFEERTLFSGLDQRNFVFNSDSFYTSKGTDESHKILFRALYGEDVEVIKPSEYLIRPSNADYKVTQDFIVEKIQGNPLDLKNRTLFQDSTNARGSVTNVKKIFFDGNEFYQISIDYGYSRDINVRGTIFGTFEPNPKTKVLNQVSVGQTFIDIDSAVSFPSSGELITKDVDNNLVSIGYSSKTSNQFFGVTGVTGTIPVTQDIRENSFSYAYTDINQTDQIKVRISSSLTGLKIDDKSNYYRKDDTVLLKSLGLEAKGKKSNQWDLNVKTKFGVEEITVSDLTNKIYNITLFDVHFFKRGFEVKLMNSDRSITYDGTVNSVTSSKTLTIQLTKEANLDLKNLFLENGSLMGNSTRYPHINNYIANVQNTYAKFNGDVLVASNSVPRYDNIVTNPYDRKITFSQTVGSGIATDVIPLPTNPTSMPDHGFYTGDSVFYTPGTSGYSGLDTGAYFVKRLNFRDIKISRSKSDLFKNVFVSLEGTATDCLLEYNEFASKIVSPQGIYREIVNPDMESGEYTTPAGFIGILNNGIEVLNYKSQNSVYYGDIRNINITKGGTGYDIINPPVLDVQDVVGSGATGSCNVIGGLYEVQITDPGLGYREPPVIKISGGNGKEASAEAKLIPITYTVPFNAEESFAQVDLTENTIAFSTYSKMLDGEEIIYQPGNPNVVVGLNTGQTYFASIVTDTAIKLHLRKNDALVGINTVDITGFGDGIQYFTCAEKKNIVSRVIITNPGYGYENKKRTIPTSAGIQTSLDRVHIKNHGYKEKEIIRYTDISALTRVGGLRDKTDYYCRVIDEDTFELSEIGSGDLSADYYYEKNIIVNLTKEGQGHFNYPPIEVTVEGLPAYFDKTFVSDFTTLYIIESPIEENIETPFNVLAWTDTEAEITNNGSSTSEFYVRVNGTSNWLISDDPFIGNQRNYDLKIQPIFRGSISSIDLTDGGVGYGSSEIIDFNRQPDIQFDSGKGARLTPIINNGQITDIIFNERGSEYNAVPDLKIISETGNFAVLTPYVSGGQISGVDILNGGKNYVSGKTFIEVIPAGSGARANCDIHSWNINLFNRVLDNIKSDDGVIAENIGDNSLEYSHIYAPRPLRENINSIDGFNEDNINYGVVDLQKVNGKEIESKFHSPIIGWAYDGNPIYGPYGFENADGTGSIVKMTSGYELSPSTTNRPPFSAFESGFFVDDYKFVGNSTLDDHNGRFCVTPDYPNGIYAYFTTLEQSVDSSGPFNNYFKPKFPYLVGKTFRTKPNDFNFKTFNNQTEYDIESNDWFRNSNFYFTNGGSSEYDYIFNSNKLIQQGYDITATTTGTVDSLDIQNPGTNYQVLDRVRFDEEVAGGRGLDVRVDTILGKEVAKVQVATSNFVNVEFQPFSNNTSFQGFTTSPHNFENQDIININGLTEYFKDFNGSYKVGITSEVYTTTLGIASVQNTGICTYIYVAGRVSRDWIRENDILIIQSEKLKVLNVDEETRRLRVLRTQDSTLGPSYPSGTIVIEDPRKFNIQVGSIKTTKSFFTNREYYFDLNESVGVGTQLGTGVGNTITFSNPGVALTQIYLNPQEIYLPSHNLKLNDRLTFHMNGSAVSPEMWNGEAGSDFFDLDDVGVSTSLYAVPFTKDIIGIATNKVGISSTTGSYVGVNSAPGILFFNSVGSGTSVSLKSNFDNVITGQVDKNIVTVGLSKTHSMKVGDVVDVSIKPSNIVTVDVRYNQYNRRMVFDPQGFSTAGVDTSNNRININDHGYVKGDKVLYNADVVIEGLSDEGMYYVVPYTPNDIQLVQNKSDVSDENPSFIDFGSQSKGTLSKINPSIKAQRNQTVRFDLSDSSLAFTNGSQDFAAFILNIYRDYEFTNNYYTTQTEDEFEVTYNGTVGVTSDAYVDVFVSDALPSELYYKFENNNLTLVPSVFSEISIDDDVNDFNQIDVVANEYSGSQVISGIASTTFSYSVNEVSDLLNFDKNNSTLSYTTNSRFDKGGVGSLKFFNKGAGYKSIPGFTSITSNEGTGALLVPRTTSIGKILNSRATNIGFDYPTDTTMRGVANLPEILKVTPLLSFERIGISSAGINYVFAPKLVVKDGFTNDLITDVILRYELGDTEVTILKNTQSLYDVTPSIIPTENTNGFSISTATYDTTNQIVRLVLNKQFSEGDSFPFAVGEKIIVENISVGVNTTGRGYNSEDYDFDLFEITAIDAQFGGANAYVEYSLSDYLTTSERPGLLLNVSSASVTPEGYFPIFDPTLKITDFAEGETVTNEKNQGTVERWDPVGQLLYVSSQDDFVVGTALTSNTTNIKSIISEKIEYNAEILTGAGATFIDGWQNDSGKLNENLQVLPNNEYYQNFSYSLKSRIPYQTWNDPVSAMNHTAGFDKYSDLVIETTAQRRAGAIDIDVDVVVDLNSKYGINCYPDFDGGSEITIDVNGTPVSNEIVFDNRIIQDYFESRGNRVLSIDNISDGFDSNPRENPFQTVAEYEYEQTYAKIFTFVRDTNLIDRTQFAIVDVLQNDGEGFTNQYARIETDDSLGWFNYGGISTTGWKLDFYPYEFEYNNYSISAFSINVNSTLASIGSTGLGDVVDVSGFSTNVSVGTTTDIVSFSSTYRAAKILVQYEDTNSNFYSNELNILHDGTNVLELQYGDLTNDEALAGITGFGTYISEISGNDVIVKFVPSVSAALTATGSIVAISTSGATGVSTVELRTANVSSYTTTIASSGTPTQNVIAPFVDPQSAGYFFISIEDTTNNNFELVEVAAIDTQVAVDDGVVEFGEIFTNSGLGTIGVTTSGTGTNVVFTPLPSIDVEVRAFGITLMPYDNNSRPMVIDLENNQLISTNGSYTGTQYDKETSFTLKHNDLTIFSRQFDGSNSAVVEINNNQIDMPNHYFVTGEKVEYLYEGSTESSQRAVGIATTTIAGISTDKLPTELFVVKRGENKISFAASAFDALSENPTVLDIDSVGIGNSHKIVATNQNAKALMAIDNMIQAPITEVSVATTTNSAIIFDTTFDVAGIQSFKANDIIKIDDELMKIRSIGVGATNRFDVLRAQMGSLAVPHGIGATVNLMGGNYIIRESIVFFESAPYGNIPIGTTTAGPDEVDWSGITTHSTFQGRTFMRSGVSESVEDTYADNYTFDNIQAQFDGVRKEFTLTNNGNNVVGFATNQAIILNSNILQEPQGVQFTTGDINLIEGQSGISSIQYIGEQESIGYDPSRSSVPRGGIIVSVASTNGFGYQPLVAAGGTAVVSVAGTIDSVSIGNSGSGYRTGIQTTINVYVQDEDLEATNIVAIGTATVTDGIITNVAITTGGSGYSQADPPKVIFDEPVGYFNIPLIYSSSAQAGAGLSATVDITVGQGSSVIDFELRNLGYGYGEGQVLTVGVGGTVGIPTNTDLAFEEFQLTITEAYRDTFNGWTIGEIDVFDKLDDRFDGTATDFSLTIDKQVTSIYTPEGSLVDLKQNLMVFINDVLQRPGEAYLFEGGSVISFANAPSKGDTCKILFYKGTPDVDVVFVDILETVKVGDTLELKNDSSIGQDRSLDQEPRVITGITTLDIVSTNAYRGPGVTTDKSLLRPITWCKQTDDIVIDGDYVTKDRIGLEPIINPTAYLTSFVGVSSINAYVDSVRPFFDQENETAIIDYQFSVDFIDQNPIVSASATATVSAAGTVSAITVGVGGSGYSNFVPSVTISSPGFSTANTATATAVVTGDEVISITVNDGGSGYSSQNPPVVLIEVPTINTERVAISTYSGDQGYVVGIGTTSGDMIGGVELYIPTESFLRDSFYSGVGVTVSLLDVGDVFVLSNCNQKQGGSPETIDGIYTVTDASTVVKNIPVLGVTTAIRRIEFEAVGVGSTNFSSSLQSFDSSTLRFDSSPTSTAQSYTYINDIIYGEYSFGKLGFDNRNVATAKTFTAETYQNLSNSTLVMRDNPLRFVGYATD